jgi:hypothetical protein
MSFSRWAACLSLLISAANAGAEGFVLGAGIEGDNAGGRAISAFGDFGLSDKAWLSVVGMKADTEGIIQDNETWLTDVAVDYFFDPVGIRIGGGYWGNPDILDSRDFNAALYLRGEAGSITVDYERRNFEFDLQSDQLRGNTVKWTADGWGLNARLALGERVNLFAGGMVYDYSRNLRIQPDIDVLAFITRSRLSMINNLIDDRFSAGVEFRFGLQSIDVTAGRWQAALDGTEVDSFSLGFLTPISDRFDAEFRFSLDQSQTYGETRALSVYFYYFGGS